MHSLGRHISMLRARERRPRRRRYTLPAERRQRHGCGHQHRSNGATYRNCIITNACALTAPLCLLRLKRIYVVGIANGGFMALRLACERAGAAFAGIVAYAAGVFASECSAAAKVPLLLVQGNKDVIVPFGGGINSAGVAFPGFRESTQIWASSNGCSGPQLSSFTATGSNNNHLRIDDTKYTNCSVPFESWCEHRQHACLAGRKKRM